jgi:hypothetical protein
MGLFHHITVFFISEQEKRDFLEAGVEFKEVTRGPRGECAIFEIGEDDARWERVAALVATPPTAGASELYPNHRGVALDT